MKEIEGVGECQLCGFLTARRKPIHIKGERPNSIRYVCRTCQKHDDGTLDPPPPLKGGGEVNRILNSWMGYK